MLVGEHDPGIADADFGMMILPLESSMRITSCAPSATW
jgi:hypothetical protein